MQRRKANASQCYHVGVIGWVSNDGVVAHLLGVTKYHAWYAPKISTGKLNDVFKAE
jgi:hypothetical protein